MKEQHINTIKMLEDALALEPNDAETTHNLAAAYSHQARIEKNSELNIFALELYSIALKQKIELYGPNHPSVALTIRGIGNCYLNNKDYEVALVKYNQALAMQQHCSANEDEMAETITNIGLSCYRLKLSDLALLNYHKALELFKNYGEIEYPKIADVFYNIALVYESAGDFAQAQGYFIRSGEIYTAYYPANYPNLVNVNIKINKNNEILKKYEKDLAIKRAELNSLSVDIEYAEAQYETAILLKKLGKYQEALDAVLFSNHIYKRLNSDNSQHNESIFKTILEAGNILAMENNNIDNAIKYYHVALGMLDVEQHPLQIANLIYLIAECYKNMEQNDISFDYGQYEKALYHYEEALKIYQENPLEEHSSKIEIIERKIQLMNALIPSHIISYENNKSEYIVANLMLGAFTTVKQAINSMQKSINDLLVSIEEILNENLSEHIELVYDQLDQLVQFTGSRENFGFFAPRTPNYFPDTNGPEGSDGSFEINNPSNNSVEPIIPMVSFVGNSNSSHHEL